MPSSSINDAVQELVEAGDRPLAAALLAARAVARVLPLLAGIRPVETLPSDAAPSVRAVFSRSALGLSASSLASPDLTLASALLGSRSLNAIPTMGTSLAAQFVRRAVLHATWVLDLSQSGASLDLLVHNTVMAIESASEAIGGGDALVQSVLEDMPFIRRCTRGEDVALELWRRGAPGMVSAAWKGLRQAMTSLDDDLVPWADWYEAVVDGRDWSFDVKVDASGLWQGIPKVRS